MLLVFAATCDGFDRFTVTTHGQAVIPRGTVLDELIGALSFTGFQGFDISQSQEFRNQGYKKEQIDSVELRRLTLVIEAPEDASFDFLDSIRFHARADDLPEVLIAELDAVPRGASELELDVAPDVELKPYVVAPSIVITTSATGRRPPEQTTVNAEVALEVDISITGACQ